MHRAHNVPGDARAGSSFRCPAAALVARRSARLTQAVINLLINAAKCTGGMIELAATPEDQHLVIRVRDNGIGLEGAVLPKMFDMFFQADSSLERAQADWASVFRW
ncbi:MAG TPA: ATP-binding protein [Alphaproteobacteria bacterium]|nr:ATP-binding protein [Alphaproteobacteria bacterium]